MALGDFYMERIKTKAGREVIGDVLFADPVSDTALLCPPDGQDFYKEEQEFQSFCDETEPLRLSFIRPAVFESFPLAILSHEGFWIEGTGKFCNENYRSVWIEAEKQIECGTSGGPIVTADGELLGIVSHFSNGSAGCDGPIPFASRVLPFWVIEEMRTQ